MSHLLVMTVRLTHIFTLKSNSLRPLTLHLELSVFIAYWSRNMEQIITTVISAISPAALPIVVCVLGCVFIYLKIGKPCRRARLQWLPYRIFYACPSRWIVRQLRRQTKVRRFHGKFHQAYRTAAGPSRCASIT